MTIVDQEIIGEENGARNESPRVLLGIFLEKELQRNFELYGDAQWMTDFSTGKSMSYSQLKNAMRSVASGLRKRGLEMGDNVMIIGLNFIQIPLMTLGTWRAGGSQACLSVNVPSDVIEMRIREARSKFVLTDYDRAGRIVEVVKKFDFVKEVFVIGDKAVSRCTPFDYLLQDSGDECPENLDSKDLGSMAWLTYSSGTTGLSKGIILTQQVVVLALLRWKYLTNIEGIKYLICNPMNSMAGLALAVGLTLAHANLYCLSSFSELNLMSAINQAKPTAISIQPAHIAWICRYPHLDQYDLSSVIKVTAMGSIVNSIFEREIFNKLPNMLFLENVYGMTEIGMVCRSPSTQLSEWKGLDKQKAIASHVFGSVGKMESGCKLKVVDVNSGEKLGPNQIGEICIQSPFMLKEYLNNPQETANLIRNGWAHTGDQGYYDENENVFIVGRYKELIKYRNAHVVPTNVERYMMTHPAIADVAVVGLPHEIDGERPFAFVVLSPYSQKVTVDELIAFTNEKVMEEEKLCGGIQFVDEIPRNAMGKIVRLELMKQLKV